MSNKTLNEAITESPSASPISDSDLLIVSQGTDSAQPKQGLMSQLKTYVLSFAQATLGFTPENTSNKSNAALGASSTTFPTSNAVKTYVDAETTRAEAAEAGKQAALGFTPENVANKNAVNGYAGLDSSGKLLASQWPAGIDEVIEYANMAAFPGTGSSNIIYVAQDSNAQYRWSGSAYIEIVASPGTTDNVAEGSTNKYFTVARVLASVLTGIGFSSATAVTATDTILVAFGKLQAQITALFKIPAGGTTGQVLAKVDGTDGNTQWITPSGGGSTGPVWNRKGVALTPVFTADQNLLAEATVIYEGSPQILTNTAGSVFKMWHSQGYGTSNICYAESFDGITWVRLTNYVVANHARSSVLKVGSTYYMYASLATSGAQIDRYTSTDGVSWTLATSAVITTGGAGTWNHQGIANTSVYYDGTTWHMLLEGEATIGGIFQIGYYHSTDGITWTQYGSNPVISFGTKNVGGPYLTKIDSTFYVWCHGSPAGGELTPTDLIIFSSPDMITWTQGASGNPILKRLMADEGVNSLYGQLGDPTLLEVNGKVYLYYTATPNGATNSIAQIKVAIANMTMADLVAGNEGDNSLEEVAKTNAYDKVISDLKYIVNQINTSSVFQDAIVQINNYFQARDPATPTTRMYLDNAVLQFNRASGVQNTFSGGAGGMTLGIWGSIAFNNISGTGVSALGSVSNAGQWSIPSLQLTTIPGADASGGQFNILQVTNPGGGISSTPQKIFTKAFFTNSASVTLSNSITVTTLIPAGVGSLNLPQNYTSVVGNQYHVKFGGVYSTKAGANTIALVLSVGGNTLATATLSGFPASASALDFHGDVILTVTGISTSGAALIDGFIDYSVGDNLPHYKAAFNNGGAAATVSGLWAYPGTLNLTGAWSVADASNIFKVTQFSIQVVN